MQSEYKEYPYRIAIVALFALPSLINGMCWVVLTPISSKIQQAYGVSNLLVTLVPTLYMIVYIFVNFPSNWILDQKGIRKGVIIGAVLTALGAAIRSLVNVDFVYVVIGQVFCAIGQPFILNAPAKIATFWFKQQNRPIATAILAVINIIGTAVGLVLPSMVVDQKVRDLGQTKKQVFELMLIEFILSFIGALLIVLLFRQKPPKPPSLGAETEKTHFVDSLKTLSTDKNFILLLIGFSVLNGTFNYFGALLNYILKPFDYQDSQISTIGGGLLLFGLLSSFVFSLYIEKTNKYKRIFIICSIISVAGMLGLTFGLYYYNQFWMTLLMVLLLGLGLTPLMPLSFDFGCQIVFPIGQAQVTGILMSGGQIVGIIEILIVQVVFSLDTREECFYSSIGVTAILFLGLFGYFFLKEDLKRKGMQKQKADMKSSLVSSVNGLTK